MWFATGEKSHKMLTLSIIWNHRHNKNVISKKFKFYSQSTKRSVASTANAAAISSDGQYQHMFCLACFHPMIDLHLLNYNSAAVKTRILTQTREIPQMRGFVERKVHFHSKFIKMYESDGKKWTNKREKQTQIHKTPNWSNYTHAPNRSELWWFPPSIWPRSYGIFSHQIFVSSR